MHDVDAVEVLQAPARAQRHLLDVRQSHDHLVYVDEAVERAAAHKLHDDAQSGRGLTRPHEEDDVGMPE